MDPLCHQKLDELFREYDTSDKPGVVVGVTQGGKAEYARAFGMANVEHGVPLDLDSVLQIGSVSKQFTAFAVLLLSEQGKIDLDAPVKRYLDSFPDFEHEITLRHMVHHVSGLRSNVLYGMLNGIAPEDVVTEDMLLTMLKNQKALNFEPDTFFSYCNMAYILLTRIVASVTGKPFGSHVDEAIFAPLGMGDSSFLETRLQPVRNRAESYDVTPDGLLTCPVLHACCGSTNLNTTVTDMIKWANELIHPTVFPASVVEKACTPHLCKNGHRTEYGYGLMIHEYKGRPVVEHGGVDAGYRAHIYMVPGDETAVLLLANRGDFLSMRLAHQILDIVLDLPADGDLSYTKLPADTDISGTYYVEQGTGLYPIIKTDDGTFLSWTVFQTEVLQGDDGRYVIPEILTEFTIDSKGTATFTNRGNALPGQRMEPMAITDGDRECAGIYMGTEYRSVHEVMFEDDKLFLQNNRTGRLSFTKYDNGMYVDPSFFGGATLRFDGERLILSHNRAVDVEFTRV